ncbi:hypothetical protein J3R30DRAFT_3408385 [Lentinula aciculospora]|uniref:Uncharacterized protein n=1 Tax=Lentinula aciculospora TaxID=153920 RepID=A0A9W9A0G2_9AGAR|nr:hypothetical protein J3R30DRAFT_3408385 [Lentinula aciculospora]
MFKGQLDQVYIVWTGGNQTPRLKARVYRLCAFVLTGYVVVGILTVVGRDSTIRQDGVYVPLAVMAITSYKSTATIHRQTNVIRSVNKPYFFHGGNELGWICLSSCVADDRFSLPNLDMSALTFVHIEPTRPVATQPSATIASTQDMIQPHRHTIPEAFFDYIPPEHRTQNEVEEKRQEHQVSTNPLPLKRAYSKASSNISSSDLNSLPSSPDTPNFCITVPNPQDQDMDSKFDRYTSPMEEEKDICDR